MRDDGRFDIDNLHDTTIAQLLTHLQQLRRTVPVNYQLKTELKEKLLQRMRELEASRAQALPQRSLKKRKWWWLGGGACALVLVIAFVFFTHDRVNIQESSFVSIPLQGSIEQVDLNTAGDKIAFVAENGKLYTKSLTDKHEQHDYRLPHTEGKYNAVAWSNNDNQIALVEQYADTSRLWIIDVPSAGRNIHSSSRLVREEKGVVYSSPSWSPDDKEIAYTRLANGTEEIWVDSTVSFSERKLTEGSQPNWSPDGSRLAYVKNGKILMLNLSTGESKNVGEGVWPSWQSNDRLTYSTPAGEIIEAEVDEQPSDMAPLSVPGLQEKKVVRASWTKDGKHLLIASKTEKMYVFSIGKRN